MKRRNKIQLSSLNNRSEGRNLGFSSPSLQDELYEETDPLPLRRDVKKVQILELDDDEISEPEYDSIFKRAHMKVLNLEDMDEPVASTATPLTERVITEKDYVRLLDKEDKKDIIDQIKRYGDGSDNDMDEFEDEKLPVSNSEQHLEKEKRKRLIQEALNEKEGVSKWEDSLMSRAQVNRGPTLPQMCQSLQHDHLASTLSKLQLRKMQLRIQLESMKDEKESLHKRRGDLIERINQLGAGSL
ncbi:NTR2 (YKR022C) [Zygosaccharomyces parabailii]|nr:NTR2 (YKR022C) [Zygosaccharomyces parabailii]CDH15223.1 uncharacterized protein ZBAI_07010 [Zygosaccharomyces bailii ISA1307]